MRRPRVSVIGAGPAGLAAALEGLRRGAHVTVYEQHRTVGARRQGDFEAFENWTTDEDVLHWLERLGVAIDFPCRPVHRITLADSDGAAHEVTSRRPLVYLVKRGPEEDSLDCRLAAQAARLGAEFQFGRRVRPEEVEGPVIVATGPLSTTGVVVGFVAETSHADQVAAILSDAVAPQGYAYCVVWSGRVTLAAVVMRDFRRAWSYLAAAQRAFATMGLWDFRAPRRFGGRAHVSLTDGLTDGSRRFAGEAAGLQDYLFGFGLRYAIPSGHLAARALLTGERYDALVAKQLRGVQRAGFVNRFLFNRIGDRGYRWLAGWLSKGDGNRKTRRLYSYSPLHRALWPLASFAFR